jgi:hypothetical protein
MTHAVGSLLVSAAVLALAACADSATKVTGAPDLQPSLSVSELNPNYKHVMKLKDQAEKDLKDAEKDAAKDAKANSKPGAGTGIYYHGGPILYQTNVAAIYWASSAIYSNGPTPGTSSTAGNSGDASLVGDFLRGLGGSAYFNINTTYYDGNNVHVQNVVNYTQYWANNGSVPADGATVSDAAMLSMLQSGFNSGKLTYDRSTLYAIFTSGKVNLGGGFGSQYCAYHGDGTVSINGVTKTVLYAAMPYDYAYPSGCTSGYASPNADKGANYEVNTLAHEIEETTTDGLGTAWWDRRGYENADKCAWTWGSTYTTANGGKANMNINGKDYLVQQNWVNAGNGGCALHL